MTETEDYLTAAGGSTGEYEEKRSRFLAAVFPCGTAEQAEMLLSRVRLENRDARHTAYAYVFHDGTSRCSDDGEPHGTAGKPILDQLTGSGMTDVLVTVTRYFGGVLLGTGGLVRAYAAAASAALSAAEQVRMNACVSYRTECNYADRQRLTALIERFGGRITETLFGASVTVLFSLAAADSDEFETALRETFSARLTAEETERGFSAFSFGRKRGI